MKCCQGYSSPYAPTWPTSWGHDKAQANRWPGAVLLLWLEDLGHRDRGPAQLGQVLGVTAVLPREPERQLVLGVSHDLPGPAATSTLVVTAAPVRGKDVVVVHRPPGHDLRQLRRREHRHDDHLLAERPPFRRCAAHEHLAMISLRQASPGRWGRSPNTRLSPPPPRQSTSELAVQGVPDGC